MTNNYEGKIESNITENIFSFDSAIEDNKYVNFDLTGLSDKDKELYNNNNQILLTLIASVSRIRLKEFMERSFSDKDVINYNLKFSAKDVDKLSVLNNTLLTTTLTETVKKDGKTVSDYINVSLTCNSHSTLVRNYIHSYFNKFMIKNVNNKTGYNSGIIEYNDIVFKFDITKQDYIDYMTFKKPYLKATILSTGEYEI
jgi:hypothetical protein